MLLPQSIIEFGQGLKKAPIVQSIIKAPIVQSIIKGYKTGGQLMHGAGDTAIHSVFDPSFIKELAAGSEGKKVIQNVNGVLRPVEQPGRESITLTEKPAQFLGAYTARLIADLGTDQTRRYWWKYNNPLAISQQLIAKAGKVGEQVSQMTPTQKGLLGLATMTPVAASMGIYDIW